MNIKLILPPIDFQSDPPPSASNFRQYPEKIYEAVTSQASEVTADLNVPTTRIYSQVSNQIATSACIDCFLL